MIFASVLKGITINHVSMNKLFNNGFHRFVIFNKKLILIFISCFALTSIYIWTLSAIHVIFQLNQSSRLLKTGIIFFVIVFNIIMDNNFVL